MKTQPYECTDDQTGGKNTPGTARPQGQRGCQNLDQRDHCYQDQAAREAPFNGCADRMIAFTERIRKKIADSADHAAANGGTDPQGQGNTLGHVMDKP